MKTLLIDNNDSFTYNLEHLLVRVTGIVPRVLPYSQLADHHIDSHDLAVISPGPKTPRAYPVYDRLFASDIPILGVCLGMQIINEQFGGTTARLAGCYHGRADSIIFDGLPFQVARYHSLYADSVGEPLEVIAANAAGIPMAIRHRCRPILGYQFHPESFLTTSGEYFIEYALDFFAPGRYRPLAGNRLSA